tara:strand:- start:937 stop:1074 length:138 start_codon:yes stop_codon:yes gene_type:complete
MNYDTKAHLAEFILDINTTAGHGLTVPDELVEWAEEFLGRSSDCV